VTEATSEIKALTAMTALNSMMESGYVNICTIREVGTVLGIKPIGEAMNVLEALHCVRFEKMPVELRERVPMLIQECLGVAPIYQFKSLKQKVIEVNPEGPEVRKGVIRRLLGGKI
jgi:thymidine phosphorylase